MLHWYCRGHHGSNFGKPEFLQAFLISQLHNLQFWLWWSSLHFKNIFLLVTMSEFLNIFNNFANYILSYYSAWICCGSIFYLWFKVYFPLFLGMVTYDNEFKTKGSKIQTEDRIEPQHIRHLSCINVMKDEKTYPCHVTKSFLTCQREREKK